ncbi:uncharacterized protein EDB91DRAFT_1059117 [Suillus paluster]|uniref:uncharacterized protein n=1 Tax=Suillus paluster TaxID=48578 RepID=UPI001B86ABDD|nr:uncharacterized protein EDB91DRAFT_1059117 [Suillus paluster]KAG1730975.1 hypothetical protein EDB91DRAFT_1059117 [Suillus paluster]
MSSNTSQAALWLERSRLDGMVLGGVSYGIYLFLTVQTWIVVMQQPRYGGRSRRVLLFYIFITFALGTVSFAANAKYTEMIWIDLRDVPESPADLIENQMTYPINVLAISTAHIQEWFMQALLLHRCFVIWNWARWVTIPMITLYIAMIAISILVQIQASTGVVYYNIDVLLAYSCIEVGIGVIYTILVANRLLAMRSLMKQVTAQYDSSTYDTVIIIVVESAIPYSIFAVIFIVSFALHLNAITTICYLSVCQVQGIAQLFIILRVARGLTDPQDWSSRIAAAPTITVFSGFASDTTGKSNNESIARPEEAIV